MRQFDAAMPLRMAYREIGMAEALGASGRYIDSARTHYRAGIAAAATDARRAAGEARVAADLAQVALAERPMPVPRDLPAPPAPKARAHDGAGPGAMGGPDGPGGPDGRPMAGPGTGGPGLGAQSMRGREGFGGPEGFRGRGGFRGHEDGADPVALAELQRRSSNPEVKQLVADAIAAQSAAQRAATAGNVEEARRQMHVGGALARAARDLAFATGPRPERRAT
jgi:hypothetical protein